MSSLLQAVFSNPLKGLPREGVIEVLRRRPPKPLPPKALMKVIGSPDREHFLRNMAIYTADVAEHCRIQSDSSIVDLGCGVGRIALGFTRVLGPAGRYVGVDVWQEGIEWCRRNISREHLNFRFETVEAKDDYYFSDDPSKAGGANEFSLRSIESEAADAVFAISLFTHLKEEDLLSYLGAVRRILKPGGYFYATFFVVDENFRAFVERTGRHRDAVDAQVAEGLWYAYKGREFFVGFSRERLQRAFEANGFRVEEEDPGKWADKPNSRLWQDYFLLRRADGGSA